MAPGSSASGWQPSTPFVARSHSASALPSREALQSAALRGELLGLPKSSFHADYGRHGPQCSHASGALSHREWRGEQNTIKVGEDHGQLRVFANWPQGYCGRGVERYASGETYVGHFADAQRHGRGTFEDKGGGVLSSLWREGAPEGEGAKRNVDGTIVRTTGGAPGKVATHLTEAAAEALTQSFGMKRPLTRASSFGVISSRAHHARGTAASSMRSKTPPPYMAHALGNRMTPVVDVKALRRARSMHATPGPTRTFSRLNPTPAERAAGEPHSWREPPAWRQFPPMPRPDPAFPRFTTEAMDSYRRGVSSRQHAPPRRDDFLLKLRVAEQGPATPRRTPR